MLDSLTLLLEKVFFLTHLNGVPDTSDRAAAIPDSIYQRGDLLEVPRTLFTHFGIYLGDNRVAHLIPDILPLVTTDERSVQVTVTNTRLILGVLSKSAGVRVDTVEDFAYGATILLNSLDTAVQKRPFDGDEIASRAEKLVGKIPYSLLWNNCEHFVTYCRYGIAISIQTDKGSLAVSIGAPFLVSDRTLLGSSKGLSYEHSQITILGSRLHLFFLTV
uniref:Lecithin retinol acyltransferase n=1 Tax=Hucho hucho TaxID=62062 RepID=A0A4W5KF30_9TELE